MNPSTWASLGVAVTVTIVNLLALVALIREARRLRRIRDLARAYLDESQRVVLAYPGRAELWFRTVDARNALLVALEAERA